MKISSLYISILLLPVFGLAQQKPWTLRQCIDTGIQRNITVKQGFLNSRINEINLEQAKENLWPNLIVTDAPSLNFGKTENLTTGTYIGQNTTTNSFGITSNVNLYSGLQYQNTIKENKYIYDASVQEIEKIKNDLTLNILADYLQVIASYEQVDIAISQLESDSIQLKETKIWVDAGKYPILNLYQLQSQTSADKYNLVNAQTQLALAKVNLIQLMDIPVMNNFDVERPDINENSLSVTAQTSADIYNTAQEFLPEIKNAELSFNASEVAISVAKSLYLPKLMLNGGVKTSGNSLAYDATYQPGTIGFVESNPSLPVTGLTESTTMSNNFSNLWTQTNDNFNQNIALTLTIPIFNNFQAKNNTDIAKINNMNAKLNEESVRLTLRQSIEQAYTQLLSASAQYNAAKEAMETEKITYDNIEKKFKIGTSDATDFLVEKANYLKAQQNVVQTKYIYLFKAMLIDFYLGKSITM